ncbi:ATP-dependent DNA helicase PIF1-like protein [Tanacetum coccineum]
MSGSPGRIEVGEKGTPCDELLMKENHSDQENHAIPNVVFSTPLGTRTPIQFSPLSKGNNNVELSNSARICLTPRPRGRARMIEISTRIPFQDVTPVGSLTFKSIILNGTDLDKTVGETSTKVKSIHDNHASRFMNQTPVIFNIVCCGRGKVLLTNEVVEPPPLLKELITNKHPKRGPYFYRLHGENYHIVGPLLPETGKPAKFAQLYIFDTENEIQNRISTVSNREGSSSKNNELDYKLTTDIRDLLDEINPLVKDFRMAGERIRSSDDQKISLRLIGTRQRDGRQYNLPTRGLKFEDRPDVILRMFKIKLDCLMKELKEDHAFGRVQGRKIDQYISAKIPNKDEDPELYQLVTYHMMHGPCGAKNMSYPCTNGYNCTKKLPKQFNESTMIEDSSYEIYKRRNDGNTIKKSGTDLHNGYVVPYNPGLLRRYQDSEEFDEIKDYLNCRYLSACEAAWRIYGFDIHYRTPSVERLPFHLKDELHVIFDATESNDYAVDKGPMEWDDLNKVENVLYPTYRDACYAWGLFMLRLKVVWEKTWSVMAADVLSVERIKQGILDKLREQHVTLYGSLTFKQKGIYSTVMNAVENNKGGMFYVYVYSGTRKTYLYKIMSAALRFKGEIVLNVASSDIAALFLEGRRTIHSRFVIPINVVEDSMCHISTDSDLANLILKAKLIIWVEEPMINMHCYEAFDRILRDIYRTAPSVAFDKDFRGKVVLFGDGKVGGANDGQSTFVFPNDMLIPNTDDDIGVIIDDTYLDLLRNLWNPYFSKEKAILAPTHDMVDIINQRMLTLLKGNEKEYESLDSVCLANEDSNFDDSI